MNTLRLSIIVAVASIVHVAHAAPTIRDASTGEEFASSITVEGTGYQCLGAGVRRVLFFRAYAVTYCLQRNQAARVVDGYIQQNHQGLEGEALEKALAKDQRFFQTLANAPGDKLVIMRLVRNISKNQIADAFRSSLSEVLSQEKVDKLIATIPGDAKKGQQILIYSQGSTLVIDIAGDANRIDDDEIAKKLWLVWMGTGTPTPSLKDSIASLASANRSGAPAEAASPKPEAPSQAPATDAGEGETSAPNDGSRAAEAGSEGG